MRLLMIAEDGKLQFTRDYKENIPVYAILSHTWGDDNQEVTFKDIVENTGANKAGHRKIQFCGERAASDGIRYFWVDSCCIDKSSSAELSEAIISMFKWYQQAKKCYVYLPDVSSDISQIEHPPSWKLAFRNSRWFTRGWTLQELIAPSQVEFFSAEGQLLGTKSSLELTIHEITGVPIRALQGEPLYRFNVDERMSWSLKRETTRGEDNAYCLLGILGVRLVPMYGEGRGDAMKRLKEEVSKHSRTTACLRDLRCTDPRDDKLRIQKTKGGLLQDCYRWILSQPDYRQWRDTTDDNLLWIKGDPGKGKTMLLCGIIDEIERCPAELVSFFFCQATDARLNNATAVLRGLIYLLVDRQPSLVSYVENKYEHAGKWLFEDVNAWVALSGILSNMLRDPNLPQTTLIVDALDECVTGLKLLLDLIAEASSSPRVKWVVSSRNWHRIEEVLDTAACKVRLCLELNAKSISNAVHRYIEHKVAELAKRKRYDDKLRQRVQQHLQASAQETFLWVVLVCQELENVDPRHTLKKLNQLPPGLHPLYERMLGQADQSDDAGLCRQIMAIACMVYCPVTLPELMTLVHFEEDFPEESKTCDNLEEIIKLCGSFLTVREHVVYFVHQSARDFLIREAEDRILSGGIQRQHYALYLQSIRALKKALRRDVYGLGHPGTLIEEATRPGSDPLAAVHYSCLYWADHLRDSLANGNQASEETLRDDGTLAGFVQQKYLNWLEALSLLKSVPQGILSLAQLERQLQRCKAAASLRSLVQDAIRFIRYFKDGIERSPLQVYGSGLIFAPSKSKIRLLFQHETPQWVKGPMVEETWNACLQTLEGHSGKVWSVVFSGDGTRLASASRDRTVRLWDAATGQCLQTLEGHSDPVMSVVFSGDGIYLASASRDRTVRLWDAATGQCLQTLEGHSDPVWSVVFSGDGTRLASASYDRTVRLWDAATGQCLQTLEGHSDPVWSVVFSGDGTRLASASRDRTIRLWDAATGQCLQTLEGHSDPVMSVVFSGDRTRLASASRDRTVRLWDAATGQCLQIFNACATSYLSFTPDGSRLQTDTGTIAIESSHLPGQLAHLPFDVNQPIRSGPGLDEDRCWLTWDGHKILWLPMDFRPASGSLAFLEGRVAIGSRSGKIACLHINVDTLLSSWSIDS